VLCIQAEPFSIQNAEWKGKIEIENGIEVIKNPEWPIFDEPIVRFEEELAIGTNEEREEYQFSRISGIAIDEEERIYVLDYTEAHIKVFDKKGRYMKTIGKKGQGPGEMASPFSICIIPDDELVIQDLNNRRILYLTLEGNFLKSISTAEWVMVGAKTDSNGNIIALISNSHPDKQVIGLMKFDKEINPLITFRSVSLPKKGPVFNPFRPEVSWTLTEKDHVICGYPENYELDVYDPEGNLKRKIYRDAMRVKVSQEEIEEAKKRLPSYMKLDIPKYHAAYRDFTADEGGRIFVRTWEKEGNRNGYYFDVFDSGGKYIAKIPMEFNPVVWKNEKVYVIEEDENGFQMVKRYKVVWE
jgi:hypothetical protein